MVTIRIDHAARRATSAPTGEARKPAGPARSERPALPSIRVNGVTIGRKAIAAEMQNYPRRRSQPVAGGGGDGARRAGVAGAGGASA